MLLLLIAPPAWGFNTFQLMDPSFQYFILIKIPLAVMLGMGVLDALTMVVLLRPKVDKLRLLGKMMEANLACISMNIAVLGLVMLTAADVLTKTEYQLPLLFAAVYCMGAFAWFAWWKRSKTAAALLGQATRTLKLVLAGTTLLGYGVLYYVLYLKMFAYPG